MNLGLKIMKQITVHFGLKCGYVKLNPNPSLFYESCMIKQKYNLMRKLSIYRAETRDVKPHMSKH